jgi:hypothetical protein
VIERGRGTVDIAISPGEEVCDQFRRGKRAERTGRWQLILLQSAQHAGRGKPESIELFCFGPIRQKRRVRRMRGLVVGGNRTAIMMLAHNPIRLVDFA